MGEGDAMSFDVDLNALEALKSLLRRASEDTKAMKDYWQSNGGVNFLGEGVINIFRDTDDNIERNIEKYLTTLSTKTIPGFADSIENTIKHYRNTDAASAQNLDASMPNVDVISAAKGSTVVTYDYRNPTPAFADSSDPSQELKTLPDFNTKMPYEPSWTDISSPTGLLRDAIWEVTRLGVTLGICDRQYDIFEVVLKPVCGDWAGLKASGAAMTNLGNAAASLQTNLGQAILGISNSWHGNAANAATAHIYQIRRSLLESGTAFTKLGNEYDGAAEACSEMRSTIGNVLCDLTDTAVAVAASSAAAGGTAATGVGVPIALALGAFALTRVYRIIKEVFNIIKIVADIKSRVDALVGACKATGGDFGKIDGSFNPFNLPETPSLPH